jgi:hypothetical protein
MNLYFLLSFLLVARSVVAAEQAPAEYTDDSAFKKAILNSTNTYRKQHNATSLAWNTTLAEFAENWGESCEFGHSVCRSVYTSIALLRSSSHVEVTRKKKDRQNFTHPTLHIPYNLPPHPHQQTNPSPGRTLRRKPRLRLPQRHRQHRSLGARAGRVRLRKGGLQVRFFPPSPPLSHTNPSPAKKQATSHS